VKILFLTGSLEPGKDGVGDYTTVLAGECGRLGHSTFLLSLNDPWVTGPLRQPNQLRLGARMSWPDRVNAARAFLAQCGPEIVSLQFVPYSFHAAGLNFALPQILSAIIGHRRVHAMFHELWIGAHTSAPLKLRIFGFCQRKIIENTIRKLDCRVIHTSNPVYIRLLARYGLDAKYLPLFGSVPVTTADSSVARADNKVLHLGMFGAIHPEWSPAELFARLESLGNPVRLTHIGRIGPGESLWTDLTRRYGLKVEFGRLGERSLEDISRFLSSVDFGVSATPLSLIGKSGSVAAMLDHGLPVIVSRNDVHFRGIPGSALDSELLIPVDANFLKRLTAAKRQPPKPRLPKVAAQFLKDLGA
jgi:glycosyltransferase involved in cell wall biosynthesis